MVKIPLKWIHLCYKSLKIQKKYTQNQWKTPQNSLSEITCWLQSWPKCISLVVIIYSRYIDHLVLQYIFPNEMKYKKNNGPWSRAAISRSGRSGSSEDMVHKLFFGLSITSRTGTDNASPCFSETAALQITITNE